MAVTKTAKRALRQAANRKVVNDKRKKIMKEAVKSTRALITSKSKEVKKDLSKTFAALDKAAKGGIIKKGTADRKKSRLAKAVAKIEK